MTAEDVVVEELADPGDARVREMLVELALEEQERYDHPRQSREQIEDTTPPVRGTFTGENHVFAARDGHGRIVGMCWCVLFDPGTGLEGEVAEVYVDSDARGRGIADLLLAEAMQLFRARNVTFASVWTRDDNPAAMAAYRRAGFAPTEQAVLTWLPLPDEEGGG